MLQPDLSRFANSADFPHVLQALAEYLRAHADQPGDALGHFRQTLQANPDVNWHVAALFHQWLLGTRLSTGFVQTGIYSRQGFMRELKRRLYDAVNPPPGGDDALGDLLHMALRRSDLEWINRIGARQWLKLYDQLAHPAYAQESQNYVRSQLLHAAEMLALWIAAEDLNPDLIRLNPRLLEFDSAFISLQREVYALVDAARDGRPLPDTAPLAVMLDQSREQVTHLRRLGNQSGASLATAHLLERLEQSLERLEGIVTILTSDRPEQRALAWLVQIGQMVSSGLEQRSTRAFVRTSAGMLSKSISASKSEHGEHYITTNAREYWHMLFSASGAGVIIAMMALLKIEIGRWGLGPFWSTVLVSLNYGIGFVIVHMLGCTIATKQPAMTAASIAEAVKQGQNSRSLARHLADLLISVNRSQSVAVLGNVTLAMLTAALISWLYQRHAGQSLLSPAEVAYQMKALQPIPALWYAAIAALWLFCAGIISGYYDNRAGYLRLRERLGAHPALAFMGDRWRQRFANYVHDNFGALHGNFYFGVLLGVTPFIGHMLHLPLDIRHIAFSSANLSYSAVSGNLALGAFLLGLLYVVMIGMVNLWLSFFLALRVGLRARDTEIPSLGKLLAALGKQVWSNPLALLFPVAAATGKESGKDVAKERGKESRLPEDA